MSDLRERVPGHSLIDELLNQWDLGTIHIDAQTNGVVIDEEAEGWYRGVIGERKVGALLAQLGEGWTVLHSVPVGRGASDIDHVVIGPPGVLTINTKFSPGKDVWVAGRGMYVGGTKQQYVTNALYEARRASNYLSQRSGLTVPVIGVIAFVDPARITYKAPAGGGEADPEIRVVRDTELLNVLRTRAEFSEEQVARIVDAAARPETWSENATPSTNGARVSREFQALEQEVGPRLSLPRGQVRAAPARAQRPARSYSSARSQPSRSRSRSSRSRRPRQSLGSRLLTDVLLPAVGFILVWIVYQQILEGWLASR
jgi:hypothetical protein